MNSERVERINCKLQRELGNIVLEALYNPSVIEIMLNPDGNLWAEFLNEGIKKIGIMSATSAEALMATLASSLNTIVSAEKPIIECELPINGARFAGILPPVVSQPSFSIRKRASSVFTLDDYVNKGIINKHQQQLIYRAVEQRQNILIVGGTGSGKTTLTNAIIDYMVTCSPTHRLVIIEDTTEIQCNAENAIIIRSTDSIDMQRLVKTTLRLRPDRILIGEVRGGEALSLLKAWNTGHPGGVATLHANSAYAGLIRLEQLVAEVSNQSSQLLIGQAIDVVIVINKTTMGRVISEIMQVNGFDKAKNDYEVKNLDKPGRNKGVQEEILDYAMAGFSAN